MEDLVENPIDDVSQIIGLQIQDNLIIQERLAKNDDKFDKLLQVVQELKSPSNHTTATNEAAQPRYSENRLTEVEQQIKETAAEHTTLKRLLNNSTAMLLKLAARVEEVDQYIKRENLFFKFSSNFKIPYHLKGYKFTAWLANTINRLIPNLDFKIIPTFISVSHPMSPKSNVVIARFAIRDIRNEIFLKRHLVVNSSVEITEHLTPENQLLLNTAQKRLGPGNAWSNQTKLYGKAGGEVVRIKSMDDVDLLTGMKWSAEQPILPVDEHDLNLNPRFDLEEIECNWPRLSQRELTIAMNNFVSKRGARKRRSPKSKFKGSRGNRSKQYLVPPPMHHSYSTK